VTDFFDKESAVRVSTDNLSPYTESIDIEYSDIESSDAESLSNVLSFKAVESTLKTPFTPFMKDEKGTSAQTKTKAKSIKNINVFFFTAAKLLIK